MWHRRRSASAQFRAAGGDCGDGAVVNGDLRVAGPVRVGDNLLADGLGYPVVLAAKPGARLEIGDSAYLNRGADITAWLSITVGDNLRMGEFASVQDWDGHALEDGAEPREAPVRIGDNVWLGRRSMVLPGVTIGDHAVVAAGAVVVRDVQARTVVGGVPARVVREGLSAPDGWRRA